MSVVGVHGAFIAASDVSEIGSPGTINSAFLLAANDEVTTSEDTAVSFDVLANDSDADGDAVAIASFITTSHGDLVSHGDGTFTYTRGLYFNGTDSFSYTISDGHGATSMATVNVAVSAVNDAPLLTVPATQTTLEDIAVVIGGIAVADIDAGEGTGEVRVTLMLGSGKLTVSVSAAGGLAADAISGH